MKKVIDEMSENEMKTLMTKTMTNRQIYLADKSSSAASPF
jgi:hypothetical protein